MKLRISKPAALGAICLAAMLMAAGSAKAIITYSLDTGNAGGLDAYSGPYGSVSVDLTSGTTASITFTFNIVGGNIYLFGGQGAAGVNVNAASWTIGSYAGANAGTGFTPGGWSDGGAANEDGFGSFNQTIDSFDGYTHSSDTLSFILTRTSAGTWASASDVLTPNASGNYVAAHIFVTSSPAYQTNGAALTGYASGSHEGGGTPTPDGGSTLALLGTAVVGFGALSKKLRKA